MAKKRTTYKKGLELEIMFAEFMKEELGYNNTRVRAKVPQKNNNTGIEVDVIGKRLDERGKIFNVLAIISIVLFMLLFIYGLVEVIIGSNNDLSLIFIISFVFGIGGIAYLLLSNHFNQENAWVECKNLKGKANITQVNKMIMEIEEYKLSKDNEYKFINYFFVSANGFIENAIKKAMDKGIDCYSLSNGKFIEEKYWN